MKLSEFKELIRMLVPGAKSNVINDSQLNLLVNRAVHEINELGEVYVSDSKIDLVTDQVKYQLSSLIPDFLSVASGGIWIKNSSTANWRQLDPETRFSIDQRFPNWRDASSSTPRRYFREVDHIHLYPASDADYTDGVHVHYLKKAVDMTNENHYPFTGSTTEIAALSVLDNAIIAQVRSQLIFPLGKDSKGIISENQYERVLEEKIRILRRNPDFKVNPNMKLRIRSKWAV